MVIWRARMQAGCLRAGTSTESSSNLSLSSTTSLMFPLSTLSITFTNWRSNMHTRQCKIVRIPTVTCQLQSALKTYTCVSRTMSLCGCQWRQRNTRNLTLLVLWVYSKTTSGSWASPFWLRVRSCMPNQTLHNLISTWWIQWTEQVILWSVADSSFPWFNLQRGINTSLNSCSHFLQTGLRRALWTEEASSEIDFCFSIFVLK